MKSRMVVLPIADLRMLQVNEVMKGRYLLFTYYKHFQFFHE
jgi:hypothetical protein